jgi:hypothetical protein
MIWQGWRNVPVRKPLAVIAFIWTVGFCSIAFYWSRDIPPGIQSVMIAVVPSCIIGYAGSSAWEATKKDE